MPNDLTASREVVELLRDILIVQLSIAGLSQQRIRAVVGGSIERVNRTAKHLRHVRRSTERAQ